MKIKVIKTAFYNGAIVNVNDVIDFKGDKLPLWGTLASGKQQQKQQEKQQNKKQENKQQQKQQEDAEKLPDNNEQVNGTLFVENIAETKNETEEKQDDEVPAVDDVVDDDADANNATKLAVLENLLNKSVELNCPIDTENKTIQQQIDELTKVIAEKESKK